MTSFRCWACLLRLLFVASANAAKKTGSMGGYDGRGFTEAKDVDVQSVSILGEQPRMVDGRWLSDGTVFLIDSFISKRRVRKLKDIANHLFSVGGDKHWKDSAVNDAFAAFEQPVKELSTLDDVISNLTGIPAHDSETPFYFTRHSPGALPPGAFVHSIHHDKNRGERRTVTVLIYLSSARSNADGGHTLFLQLPRPSDTGPLEEQEPLQYLRRTFRKAFHAGKRELVPHELAETADAVWDPRALELAEHECELALQGRNNVLAVLPKRGSALVMLNAHADGSPNLYSWHTACHAVKGAARSTVQKFKEPPIGGAVEDVLSVQGRSTDL